jgi:hypothetical protein
MQAVVCALCALFAAMPAFGLISRSRATPHDHLHTAFLAVTSAFLFGYQMHEKTILLPVVVLSLAYPRHTTQVLCVNMAALLSMYDLLHRDGHCATYVASMLLIAAAAIYTRPARTIERVALAMTVLTSALFHVAESLLPPPASYPWLYPYFASLICCCRHSPQPHTTSPGARVTHLQPLHLRSLSVLQQL